MHVHSPRFLSLVVFAAMAMIFGACGGDSSDGDVPVDGAADQPWEGTGDAVEDEASPPDTPPGEDGTAGDGDVVPDGEGGLCGEAECSNCLDDDGDTFIDGFDPHCTGSLDDDEASFATDIPGDNRDATWQDCFFDGNSGGGDDGCRFHTCCMLGTYCPPDLADHFDEATDCEVSTACIEYCLPATSPGCDCFGCCQIWVDGVLHTVMATPECTDDLIGDPTFCIPCTQTEDCGDPCVPELCELCPGMTVDDLPPECDDTTPTCPDGVTTCTATPDCPTGYYCSVGCCVEDVMII